MKNLLSLLGRFRNSLTKDTLLKEQARAVIEEEIHVTLSVESVSLKDGRLEVSASPVVYSEIKLKEEIIKKRLSLSRIFYK